MTGQVCYLSCRPGFTVSVVELGDYTVINNSCKEPGAFDLCCSDFSLFSQEDLL
jgi:hypothetical protein